MTNTNAIISNRELASPTKQRQRRRMEHKANNPIEQAHSKIKNEIHHKKPSPKKQYHPLRSFIRERLPLPMYIFSSVLHLFVAGALKLGGFSKDVNNKLTSYATGVTQVINSAVYTDLAVDAVENGFSFDFIGRSFEPICNLFVDLNHYHLFRAFSSAFNQLHMTNFSRIKKGLSLMENFWENLKVTKEIFLENWNKKILTKDSILLNPTKNPDGFLAVISHLQLGVGVVALFNGNNRNLLNRIIGLTRNAIGLGADIGLSCQADPVSRRTGYWYISHAVGDFIKYLVPEKEQDFVNNLIMPFYNGALYNFGLTTRRQISGEHVANTQQVA